ncbi:MAG: class I SAM-dependent methyltransferase [Cyanobacteria bacterium P01_F01_bin.53]
MSASDPTSRFSDRVDNYVRYRPTYPKEVLSLLTKETGLSESHAIADIGSGTGISAQHFLNNGNHVFGIEPNLGMRQTAEKQLNQQPNFHSITGTAEATTLADKSIDYVIAAQAFHWFDQPTARLEFSRILRPEGWVVLIWNSRRKESTEFLKAYEALLQQYGTDYNKIRHTNTKVEDLIGFFGGAIEQRSLYNEQIFNFESLKGRLLSSSYVPNVGHTDYQPMINTLETMFQQHQQNGQVVVEYDTQVYFGQLYSRRLISGLF